MADHDDARRGGNDAADDFIGRKRIVVGIKQLDGKAGVDQRPTDGEQPERRQVIIRNPAADGGVRRIEQENFMGGGRHGELLE